MMLNKTTRTPLENMKVFIERRKRLSEILTSKFPGSALVVSAPSESSFGYGRYRQDSNLYYLTGFEEPNSIFLFRPGQTPESVLFVRKKNPEREMWDGFRYGEEAAQIHYKMDKVFPIEEFEKQATILLKDTENLFFRLFKNPEIDARMQALLKDTLLTKGRTGFGYPVIHDAQELIGELRLFKGETDLYHLKRACEITSDAHKELMKYVRPNMSERELHGYFLYQIMKHGCARENYEGIFASGSNACTLHYTFNDQVCRSGELILVDAAGEYNYFGSDITRTYPINGKFTDAQAEVYEGVLNVQKTVINMVRPGITFEDLVNSGVSLLTDLILDLGLISGRKEDVISSLEYKKYYPHKIGHFLGMDVHDVGLYYNKKTGQPRVLEPGMVFTVEPGIYIPFNDTHASEEYQGIGIRIEDNILVTENGFENLTDSCPKEIQEIEEIMK